MVGGLVSAAEVDESRADWIDILEGIGRDWDRKMFRIGAREVRRRRSERWDMLGRSLSNVKLLTIARDVGWWGGAWVLKFGRPRFWPRQKIPLLSAPLRSSLQGGWNILQTSITLQNRLHCDLRHIQSRKLIITSREKCLRLHQSAKAL